MRFKLRVAAVAAVVSTLVLVGDPASAVTISDGTGVDYDAACVFNTDAPPPPNSVGSPGTSPCQDGSGLSIYDGRTEATDILGVHLASTTAGQFVATCELDQIVPAGDPNPFALDRPADVFTGTSCKVMFQNPRVENNVPSIGCARVGTGTAVFDQHGHWADGFHFFIGFNQSWNGTRWIHSAQLGEYNPAPDGGFPFYELGTNDGSGWTGGANVTIAGSTVTITASGIFTVADANCASGRFTVAFARPGHPITNVKGLTTADVTYTLPVTVPFSLAPGFSDTTSTGGYTFFSDVTAGNSRNVGSVGTLLRPNMVGVSYSTGILERNRGGATLFGQSSQVRDAGSSPQPDPFDTLGEGPRCPTPTFGGLLPSNPLWVPDQACHIDDDNIPGPSGNIDPGERGTFLPEFWDTNFGFTF